MEVAVIGAGASGLCAAIVCAKKGAKVSIFEHTDMSGKKILSTGNGKCNYTNLDIRPMHYYNNPLAAHITGRFDTVKALDFFKKLGVNADFRDTYAYPASGQAKSVLEALMLEIKRLEIKIFYDTDIEKIVYSENVYKLHTKSRTHTFDKVILATGSKAFKISGSDGSGLKFIKDLGIKYNNFTTALVPLICKEKGFFKKAFGVRAKAKVSLYINDEFIAKDEGELQITDTGLSGIPVFQISRYASKALYNKEKVEVFIDFLPGIKDKEKFLYERLTISGFKQAKDLGIGIINSKLWQALLDIARIKPDKELICFSKKDMEMLEKILKSCKFSIYETASFDKAQVCTGGVDINELDFSSLEVKKYKGLYIIGELVDVDGMCGGYNLHWAVASANIAGEAICSEIINN